MLVNVGYTKGHKTTHENAAIKKRSRDGECKELIVGGIEEDRGIREQKKCIC